MSKTDFTQPNAFSSVRSLWGIEFADSRSFFTLTGKSQYLSQETLAHEQGESTLLLKQRIHLTDGEGVLTINEQDSMEGVVRTHEFEAQKETHLLDFVSRYVFPKEWFDFAIIHGRRIEHQDQNIYYQFPLEGTHDTIQFVGPDGNITIRVSAFESPASFTPYLYVRDEPGSWIAHIRFLPSSDERIITKLNYSFYNKAIPSFFNALLLAVGLKRFLLYRGEKKTSWSWMRKQWYRFLPLTSYRLGRLQAGEKVTFTTTCQNLLK
ncbi:MAG: hypothetical protein NTX72_04410 [Candidatus Uhrbacteria bacterium]|nr:hypothetical protein [Candidatus Uhrbacteria bacterium]